MFRFTLLFRRAMRRHQLEPAQRVSIRIVRVPLRERRVKTENTLRFTDSMQRGGYGEV